MSKRKKFLLIAGGLVVGTAVLIFIGAVVATAIGLAYGDPNEIHKQPIRVK